MARTPTRIRFPGPLLLALRQEKFLGQFEFAEACEVSDRTIRRIEEKPEIWLNVGTFRCLAKGAGQTPQTLFQRVAEYWRSSETQSSPAAPAGLAIVVNSGTRAVEDEGVERLMANAPTRLQESSALKAELGASLAYRAVLSQTDPRCREIRRLAARFGNINRVLRIIEDEIRTAKRKIDVLLLERAAYRLLIGDPRRASASVSDVLASNPADVRALLLRAQIERFEGQLDTAKSTYEQVERLAKHELERMHALSGLGLVHRDLGNLGESLASHRRALAIAEQLGLLEYQADEHRFLGVVHRRQRLRELEECRAEEVKRVLADARRHYARAIRLSRLLRDNVRLADTLDHVGVLHLTMRESARAEIYHRRAMKLNNRRRSGRAIAMGNLVISLGEQGKLVEAVAWQRRAMRLYRKMGWSEHIARGEGNLAECYTRLQRVGLARRHWTKAKSLFQDLQMPVQAAACETNLRKLVDSSVRDPYMA